MNLVRYAHQKSPSTLTPCLIDMANLVHLLIQLLSKTPFSSLFPGQKIKMKRTIFDTVVDLFGLLQKQDIE